MKKQKITNTLYRQFLDQGLIRTLTEIELQQALKNVTGKNSNEGQNLLILLYYTGCRPNEALRIKAKDIKKQANYITILTPPSKNGLARTIFLRYKLSLVKKLYKYTQTIFNEAYLFPNYRSNSYRTTNTRSGLKTRHDVANKLRYHFNKWFEGVTEPPIPPYYLRHSRFSRLAEAGLEAEDIRVLKGAKSLTSVFPYLHLSTKTAKKISRKID